MRRRDFLGTAAFAPAMLSATEPLSPGQRFNESVEFRDSVTGHPSRRLTTKRRFNQKSTYTQNACFSADSRRMVMSTEDAAGNSALLTGEVETGDIRVIAVSTRIKDTPQKPDINGNNICLNQAGNWAAAAVGGSIRVWDLESMAEKVLYIAPNEHIELGHPIGSIDGKRVYFTVQTPSVPPNDRPTGRHAFSTFYGAQTDFIEADIKTGRSRVFHREANAGCNHLTAHPTNPDLLLIDRDWPRENARLVSRAWVLNHRTDELTEIRPRDKYRATAHSNFNGRGDRVYYHGASSTGGEFIGVTDLAGKVEFHYLLPARIYSHMGVHPTWDAMIVDGLVSTDLVCAIFYKEIDAMGCPRIQVLARHSTDWDEPKYGQYSHPHCSVSPDGRWLSYNRGGARTPETEPTMPAYNRRGAEAEAAKEAAKASAPGDGRTDVFVVRIG